MTPTYEVEINGKTYQIGRFTARNGSWILTQILTKMLPSAIGASLPGLPGRSDMSEDEFANIQGHCLAVVKQVDANAAAPLPVFVRPNTWAVKELEYDLIVVMKLTIEALSFNLTPFFQGDGLEKILGALPEMGL